MEAKSLHKYNIGARGNLFFKIILYGKEIKVFVQIVQNWVESNFDRG